MQVLGEAIEGAKSINDDKLADYLHNHEFKTIMGDFTFGKDGEWTKSAMLQVQYHGITEAANLETWRGMELSDGADAGRSEDRRRHLSLRQGEVAVLEAASSLRA